MFNSVRLQKYRSYDDFAVEFGEGVSIIIGPNAAGKTNLLEAILVLARGSSYRSRDIGLVKRGEEWSRLDAVLDGGQRTVKLQVQNSRLKKTFIISDKVSGRISFDKRIPTVLFEPDHLRLFSGSPERRREFIDSFVDQYDKTHLVNLRVYKRILAHRNALLKSKASTLDDFFVWNVKLSDVAGRVYEARQKGLSIVEHKISERYSSIAGRKSSVTIKYKTELNKKNYSDSMLAALNTNLSKDRVLGYTTSGPHRDDIWFELNGAVAEESASRGEVRSLILALKIIELEELESYIGQRAVLLLDDVFSELDGRRRRLLTEMLSDRQSIITTTDADVVGKNFTAQAKSILL